MEFFNGLGKKLVQKTRSSSAKGREETEQGQQTTDLQNARENLEHALDRLSRAYDQSAIPDLIRRVREAQELVDALKAQQERAAEMIRCPNCGTMQTQNARYCSNCGRPMPEKGLEDTEEGPNADLEYCPDCGALRQDDAKYCAICGKAFGAAEKTPQVEYNLARRFDFEMLEEPEYLDGME